MKFTSHYPYPPRLIVPLVAQVLLARPLSLASIAQTLVAGINPPPNIFGIKNIPPRQPFVLVFNHYESEHVDAWWGPLVIAATVNARREAEPRELRFLMAREWRYAKGWEHNLKQPLSRWLFSRLAKSFGLVPVPPVLDSLSTRGEGVAAVRQVLALTRASQPTLIALAPEGTTGPDSALREPPSGVGFFLSYLSHHTAPLLPAAWYEDSAGTLTLNFGETFFFESAPAGLERHQLDKWLAAFAMRKIAMLLPEVLRGRYS